MSSTSHQERLGTFGLGMFWSSVSQRGGTTSTTNDAVVTREKYSSANLPVF